MLNTHRFDSQVAGIHQLFEQQVQRFPDAPALVDSRTVLTYQQLDNHATQLAHYLQFQGVKLEMPVGLFLDRSADMIIAMLAGHIPDCEAQHILVDENRQGKPCTLSTAMAQPT